MSESGPGIAAAAAAAAGGPTFLDNFCVHLASTLLGSATVTDLLTTAADATRPHQLYWRSPSILSPLSVLQSTTSPVVSQEAQSRVVYADLTVWFLPPADSDSSKASGAKRPRVRAKFGALVRHWHPIRLDAGSGVIDRTCRPNGGTYVQQDRYLSKRGLKEYGDSINIDMESMESRPTARLLGKAMGGTGLRAEVVANGNDSPKVVVTIDHQSLGETGSFAIVNGNTDDDNGRIGETAMSMLLANIEADSRRRTTRARSASRATNDSSPGAKSPSATISGVDPEEENEMRKVFEQWWDRMTRGENASSSVSKEKSYSNSPSVPIETTSRSPAAMVANGERSGITESTQATAKPSASVIGEERAAGLEQKSPAQTTASGKEQQTQANSSSLAVANGVKENVKNDSAIARASSTSAAAAKIGNDTSTGKDNTEEKTSASPSQIQKKKRKTPGPILVRAGGGKKKKKGKITIGKSV